ncbi:MAG: hypothetical protein M1821_002737 [Bathelium mastoideum]|nr:MAG: hypothetical protein M1821_002737 [Bathelium mastoideum]
MTTAIAPPEPSPLPPHPPSSSSTSNAAASSTTPTTATASSNNNNGNNNNNNNKPPPPRTPAFPPSNAPRVWLLTSGDSPVAISLSRLLLAHGDYVLAGIMPGELARQHAFAAREREKENKLRGGKGAGARGSGHRGGHHHGRNGAGGGSHDDEDKSELCRFLGEVGRRTDWKGRWRVLGLDVR